MLPSKNLYHQHSTIGIALLADVAIYGHSLLTNGVTYFDSPIASNNATYFDNPIAKDNTAIHQHSTIYITPSTLQHNSILSDSSLHTSSQGSSLTRYIKYMLFNNKTLFNN